jgi:hypothetical protein
MVRTALMIFSFMTLSAGSLMALAPQGPTPLVQKVEALVKAEKPDWVLVSEHIEGSQTSMVWKWEDGKKGIRLLIYEAASEKGAAEMLTYWVGHISVGPTGKLENLGDEAYIWKASRLGTGTIQFRKANVYINMGASSPALVEEMARRIAEMIPKK